MKKASGDVIISHMCTKNHCHITDHMMEWARQFLVILGHFLPFYPKQCQTLKFRKNIKSSWRYYPFTHVYQKWRSYDTWFLRYKAQQTEFFWHFGPFFALWLYQQPKKSKLLKIKTKPRDIIILHLCTTNDNHMIYGSWDMEHKRQIFLSFWTTFSPFTALAIHKIKILKKWKKYWAILSFF